MTWPALAPIVADLALPAGVGARQVARDDLARLCAWLTAHDPGLAIGDAAEATAGGPLDLGVPFLYVASQHVDLVTALRQDKIVDMDAGPLKRHRQLSRLCDGNRHILVKGIILPVKDPYTHDAYHPFDQGDKGDGAKADI